MAKCDKEGHAKNESRTKDDGNNSARTCVQHFHPSTLDVNETWCKNDKLSGLVRCKTDYVVDLVE